MYRVVVAQHAIAGHLGVDRLLNECARRFDFFDFVHLRKLCELAKKSCPVCEQCEPPNWRKKGKIGRFPIHPHVWDSICMDMFTMPAEEWEGNKFDSFFFVLIGTRVG